jgi:O-antigen/teichoic acid export membrane protein
VQDVESGACQGVRRTSPPTATDAGRDLATMAAAATSVMRLISILSGRSTHRLLGRLASFSGLSLLSAVAPLVVLPAVARVGGVDGWAAVTVAQAVGALAGVVVGLGFNTVGPARLSGMTSDVAARLFSSVQAKRFAAYAVVGPVAAAVSATLVPDAHRTLAVLVALASATIGLSPAWFAIGVGHAPLLAFYDSLPKLASSFLGLWVVTVTQNLLWYPILLWVFTLGGLAAFWLKIGFGTQGDHGSILKPDWHAAGAELAASCYVSAPLIVAAATFPVADVSQLGSIDKLFRYALYVVFAFTSATLAWVLEDGRSTRARRKVSLGLVSVGVVGSALLLFGGNTITGALFGAPVAAPDTACIGYALAYICVASSTPLIQFHLIPSGHSRSVLGITAINAVVGLPAMVLFGELWGVAGVAAGFGTSEFIGLLAAIAATTMQKKSRS